MANISKLNVGGSVFDLRDAASLHYKGHFTAGLTESAAGTYTGTPTGLSSVAEFDYITYGDSNLNLVCTNISTDATPVITWTSTSEITAAPNDATITVAVTGETDQTFTVNQSVDKTINVNVPVKGVQVNGTDLTPDSSTHTVNIDSIPASILETGTTITAGVLTGNLSASSADGEIANKKYVDDSIGNATITVSGTGVTAQTFTTNQSTDATITVNVPIREIKVNDTALVPDDSQSVNIEIPTDSMTFKGTVGNTEAPTSATKADVPVNGSAKVGDTYKVVTDGNYANNTIAAEVGDLLVCLTKESGVNTWVLIPSGDDVDVTSVAASTGLTTASGSAITQTGTIKMNLTSETALADTATAPTTATGTGRVFAVALDAKGHPAVNIIPGALTDVIAGANTTSVMTGISPSTTQQTGGVLPGHVGTGADDSDTLYLDFLNPTTNANAVTYVAPTNP